MTSKYQCQCDMCGKKSQFEDTKDIVYHKWKILAWDMSKNNPIVICDKCKCQNTHSSSEPSL